ncbi:MAG: AAA family ATPase, partial [Rhodanobacter sp.]
MYQAFYKLHGKPFQLTPDPAMLFPSKGHRRAMSYLLYGFEQGEGFVVITGAVGTGKTLLIQKLFEQLRHRNIVIASIASANLDGDDILPAVAAALDLPYEQRSKEALL